MAGPLWRIRDRRTFRALRADGSRRRSGPVAVTVLAAGTGPEAPPRLAFAIGKGVGPAVVRNRLRRQVRAHARGLDLPAGAYLVNLAPPAARLTGPELRSHLEQALR
jgi:ribonuclease P protein component